MRRGGFGIGIATALAIVVVQDAEAKEPRKRADTAQERIAVLERRINELESLVRALASGSPAARPAASPVAAAEVRKAPAKPRTDATPITVGAGASEDALDAIDIYLLSQGRQLLGKGRMLAVPTLEYGLSRRTDVQSVGGFTYVDRRTSEHQQVGLDITYGVSDRWQVSAGAGKQWVRSDAVVGGLTHLRGSRFDVGASHLTLSQHGMWPSLISSLGAQFTAPDHGETGGAFSAQLTATRQQDPLVFSVTGRASRGVLGSLQGHTMLAGSGSAALSVNPYTSLDAGLGAIFDIGERAVGVPRWRPQVYLSTGLTTAFSQGTAFRIGATVGLTDEQLFLVNLAVPLMILP